MNAKKWFGAKSITNLLYGIAMLLPMFSILGRVIYVQANPSAKDSYSGSTTTYAQQPKYQTNEVNSNNDLIVDNIYDYNLSTSDWGFDDFDYTLTGYLISLNNDFSIVLDDMDTQQFNIPPINKIVYSDFELRLYYYSFVGYQTDDYVYDVYIYSFLNYADNFSITIQLVSLSYEGNYSPYLYELFTASTYVEYEYVVVAQSTLDNAFDYSIESFIEGNNLGKVDLFGWFTNLFLDSNNAVNNLYVGFVNWYLNYALLISSGYLIFLVLIWFINFVRKIMDKSMYQDYGGF